MGEELLQAASEPDIRTDETAENFDMPPAPIAEAIEQYVCLFNISAEATLQGLNASLSGKPDKVDAPPTWSPPRLWGDKFEITPYLTLSEPAPRKVLSAISAAINGPVDAEFQTQLRTQLNVLVTGDQAVPPQTRLEAVNILALLEESS